MTHPQTRGHAHERSTPQHALDWRARRYGGHPAAVRRHVIRSGIRLVVLVVGDVAGLLLAREVSRFVLEGARVAPAQWQSVGPLAAPGEPASMVFGLALIVALIATGSYTRSKPAAAALRVGLGVLLASLAAGAAMAAVVGIRDGFFLALSFGLATWIALLIVRVATSQFLVRVWPRQRWAASAVAVTASDGPDASIDRALAASRGEYWTAATIPADAHVHDRVLEVVYTEDIEAIVVGDAVPPQAVRGILDIALDSGCQLLCPARAIDIRGLNARLVWHGGHAFLELGPLVLQPGAVVTKRIADVIGAALLLVVTAPLLLLIAIAVKLDSPGPVLFVQNRAGLRGRCFRMFKFRTMRNGVDAGKHDRASLDQTAKVRLFEIRGHPRVTRVGRTLRRWSLDKLPQLWNVLGGDMSLVGPRSFAESHAGAYEDRHFRRLDTKPGITGLWQVSGRSEVLDFEDVIFLDKQYIERWSLSLDMNILLRTIPAVLRRASAL